MRKVLISLITIGLIAGFSVYLTNAFFSDTETSTGNTLQAGELDLKVDNTCYYNGLACLPVLGPDDKPTGNFTWTQPNPRGAGDPNGQPCTCTWGLKDLTSNDLFFDFRDLKPDDESEDTISLHVKNDAYACMSIEKKEDDDETCTEPEKLDDPTCNDPDQDTTDGELGGLLNFIFWADDGDNVYEVGETVIKQGAAGTIFDGAVWPLADSSVNVWTGVGGPILANTNYYIGKAWCFGTLTPDPVPSGQGVNPSVDPGVNCDGTSLNNASQTDVFLSDVKFNAYQARHNESFRCDGQTSSVSPSISPTNTPIPTPTFACSQADVMLVLDRSGSIDSTELGLLKTAAKDFIDALGLSTTGIHAGFSSFATVGSLNQHLTDNASVIKTAIDALVSGGFTNLKEGLDLAMGEHANPGDGHDRPDGTSPDKVIVITDGHPNRPLPSSTAASVAKTSADNYRAAGAEIFVVGVGSDVNQAYLETIADDAAHYYPVSNYSGLKTTLEGLDLCQ